MFCRFGAASRSPSAPPKFLVAVALCSLPACSGGESFTSERVPKHTGNITVAASVSSIECPTITSYTITPYLRAAGSEVFVSSTVEAGFGVRPVYRWSASAGSFVNIETPDATYHCGDDPSPILTLTVTYGTCIDRISIVELDCT
jgi:hypothetical protein